jgi:hypothetical protein
VPGATIQVSDDAALLPVSITVTTSSTAETARAEIVFTLGPDGIVTNRPPRAVAALLEPGSTPQAPVVSDLLFISEEPASIPGGPLRARVFFDFDSSSNVEGQPLPAGIPAANVFVENGQPQIIFTTTLITSIGELPLTIIAQSDAVEVTVPEPSTLLLVSAGLLRIGVGARRRSRRS